MQKKALGRGLGALIPDLERPEPAPTEIDFDRIKTNPVHRFRLDGSHWRTGASIREQRLQPCLSALRKTVQLVAAAALPRRRAGLLKSRPSLGSA
jgi:hypothetical protein